MIGRVTAEYLLSFQVSSLAALPRSAPSPPLAPQSPPASRSLRVSIIINCAAGPLSVLLFILLVIMFFFLLGYANYLGG